MEKGALAHAADNILADRIALKKPRQRTRRRMRASGEAICTRQGHVPSDDMSFRMRESSARNRTDRGGPNGTPDQNQAPPLQSAHRAGKRRT